MSVLVFAESSEGKFKKVAFEAVSYGNQVASQLGTDLVVLTINASNASELYQYGAEKVLEVNDDKLGTFNAKAYANVIQEVASSEESDIIIIDSSANGLYLAPLVAVKMDAGLASNVMAVPSNLSPFTVKRKAFSNKAFQNTTITSAHKVIGLAKNSFGVKENVVQGSIASFSPSLSDDLFKVASSS
ncbi:MAG: electron transfer flavoprotein subunit alpha/FixB family protein, partial [Flavobacteriaceae bacterium]